MGGYMERYKGQLEQEQYGDHQRLSTKLVL